MALLPLTASIVSALRHSKLGVDALFLGQYLAGAVIALMLAGGQALEYFADSRARREFSSLLQRAPRVAHLCDGETVTSIDVEEVALGDLLDD
jgi:cation transport ATPase